MSVKISTLYVMRLPTTDDWYPNFERNTVECSLYVYNYLNKKKYKISVWGADDFGMEKDFTDETEALKSYKNLPNPITQEWLTSQGFKKA